MHARQGFTTVELAIAIGIMVLLSGMITHAVLPALRQGRVNQGR